MVQLSIQDVTQESKVEQQGEVLGVAWRGEMVRWRVCAAHLPPLPCPSTDRVQHQLPCVGGGLPVLPAGPSEPGARCAGERHAPAPHIPGLVYLSFFLI